jgi:hypothetical protein
MLVETWIRDLIFFFNFFFALLFVCFFLSLFVFTSWSNFLLDHRTFNSYNLFRIILLWNKWIRKICGNRVVLLLCFMFIKPGRCVFMYIFRLDCWTVPSSFICRLYHFSWIRERDSVYAIHFYFVDRHFFLFLYINYLSYIFRELSAD